MQELIVSIFKLENNRGNLLPKIDIQYEEKKTKNSIIS